MKWEGPDTRRPLNDKGRGQADRLGAHLARVGANLGPFLTSPKLRASETAEIVAGHLGAPVIVEHRLAGAFDVDTLETILAEHDDPDSVVLVGHDPDFSEVLAALIGADEFPMKKGALARVDIDRPLEPGTGRLIWLLPPDLLKG
jgi:phosphohistidine phosphatase